jgi:metal-responsive CopG/Arc/MetJ family transcriptional regulator
MNEKCLEAIKLHLPETLKQKLQDLAMREDRKVSEFIRVILEDYVYGKGRHLKGGNNGGRFRYGQGR